MLFMSPAIWGAASEGVAPLRQRVVSMNALHRTNRLEGSRGLLSEAVSRRAPRGFDRLRRGAGLASVSRRGYGVAPRIFFTLVFAFAIVAATSAHAAAAFAAALFLIILGGITTIVDATGFASAAEVSDSERRCLSADDRLVQGQRLLPFHQDEIDWLGSVLEMRSDKPRE